MSWMILRVDRTGLIPVYHFQVADVCQQNLDIAGRCSLTQRLLSGTVDICHLLLKTRHCGMVNFGKMLSVLIYTEPANDIKESLTFSPEFPPDGKRIKGRRFLVVN